MVGHTILWKIIGSDLFTSLTRSNLGAPILSNRGVMLGLLSLDNSRAKGSHGFRAILELRSLILAGHDHTSGNNG